MKKLNLKSTTQPQKVIMAYLEQNASDMLADKINNGVQVERDGKTLINKKTLDGFMNYANGEARKIAEKGSNYACVSDDVVFGWAIHYFEEDSIIEKLYNEDGTEYQARKSAPKKSEKKVVTAQKAEVKKVETQTIITKTVPSTPKRKSKLDENQVSLFDVCEGLI